MTTSTENGVGGGEGRGTDLDGGMRSVGKWS